MRFKVEYAKVNLHCQGIFSLTQTPALGKTLWVTGEHRGTPSSIRPLLASAAHVSFETPYDPLLTLIEDLFAFDAATRDLLKARWTLRIKSRSISFELILASETTFINNMTFTTALEICP